MGTEHADLRGGTSRIDSSDSRQHLRWIGPAEDCIIARHSVVASKVLGKPENRTDSPIVRIVEFRNVPEQTAHGTVLVDTAGRTQGVLVEDEP